MWSYHLPMALNKQFLLAFKINQSQFYVHEWASQLANCVFLVFGGMMIDQTSMRVNLCGFFMLSVLGNIVAGIGGCMECWLAFIIGRIFFMIGTEMLVLCVIITIVNMFYQVGLNYPLGISCVIPSVSLLLCEIFAD